MRESRIERALLTKARRAGFECLKMVSPGRAGVPDRLLLLPNGAHLFVEVKAPGEKLRPLQEKCKEQFERLGHKVEVVDSLASVDELIGRLTHD